MAERQYSQMEKNMLFAQLTRQNQQKEPSFAVTESNIYRFTLPQTRYTSKIMLHFYGTFDVTHASATTWTPVRHAPYALLSNITVDMNNGFAPYKTSGIGAYLNNLARPTNYPFRNVETTTANRAMTKISPATGSAGSGGVTNYISFVVELPLTINDRDPIGLVMTQNSETHVTVEINMGTILGLFATTTGYSISNISIACTPMIESYTIPINPISANPDEPLVDLQTIKLVQEQVFTISATGEYTIKLPIGTTYRRVFLDFYSGNTALTDAQVTNFMLSLNQADTPYNITGRQLQALNEIQLGYTLPAGVFLFDFSYLGFVNYGGSRDYIDTQNLNEFWIKAQTSATGTVRTVYESLVRLAAA